MSEPACFFCVGDIVENPGVIAICGKKAEHYAANGLFCCEHAPGGCYLLGTEGKPPKSPSWLDDPLAAFDKYPNARAYVVAEDVFPQVEKALLNKYGSVHFRGRDVVPSRLVPPGGYVAAQSDAEFSMLAPFSAFAYGSSDSTAPPTLAAPTTYAGLGAFATSWEDLMRRTPKSVERCLVCGQELWSPAVGMEKRCACARTKVLEERIAKLEALIASSARPTARLDALAETVDRVIARAADLESRVDERLDAMADSTNEDVDSIVECLDAPGRQAGFGAYPFSGCGPDPRHYCDRPECANRTEVAEFYTHQTRPGEWLCRPCAKGIMERPGEPNANDLVNRIVAKTAPLFFRNMTEAICSPRPGRLWRARRWLNAHPWTASMASAGAIVESANIVLALLR